LLGDLEDHWWVDVSGNWRLTFSFAGEDAVLMASSETAPRQSATFGSGSKSIRVTSGLWSLYREASGTGINTQVFDAAYPPFWPPRLDENV